MALLTMFIEPLFGWLSMSAHLLLPGRPPSGLLKSSRNVPAGNVANPHRGYQLPHPATLAAATRQEYALFDASPETVRDAVVSVESSRTIDVKSVSDAS